MDSIWREDYRLLPKTLLKSIEWAAKFYNAPNGNGFHLNHGDTLTKDLQYYKQYFWSATVDHANPLIFTGCC
jgi:hypothetical protein